MLRQVIGVIAVATFAASAVTAQRPEPTLVLADDAEIWWAITEDNLVVDVKRGENASRTLRHSGVVRSLTSKYPAKARPEWKREHLRVGAFVQSKKTRRVLSVGVAPVSAP